MGGFSRLLVGLLKRLLPGQCNHILSHTVSLARFTAPRAQKYLKQRVFKFEPNYVVIQFGTTDAQCFFRVQNRPIYDAVKSNDVLADAVPRAPTVFSRARWEMASLKGFLLGVDAVTPLSSYTEAIRNMAYDCTSVEITPVVLSPFIFGRRHSMGNAVLYTNALHELHLKAQPMIFIDCVRLLSKFPISKILLNDGVHLSSKTSNALDQSTGRDHLMRPWRGPPALGVCGRACRPIC